MSISKIISFNTGRQYSESGQRIAAAVAPNGDVIMFDIDRDLVYSISNIDLDRAAIMNAYDNGDVRYINEENFNHEYTYDQIDEFLNELRQRALYFPACVI